MFFPKYSVNSGINRMDLASVLLQQAEKKLGLGLTVTKFQNESEPAGGLFCEL